MSDLVYWLHWNSNVILDSVIAGVVVTSIPVLLTAIAKLVWSLSKRLYIKWQDRRERAFEMAMLKHSLATHNLSVVNGHFVGNPHSMLKPGSNRVKSAGQGSAPSVICFSAKGNRGNSGPWARRHEPNVLLKDARVELGRVLSIKKFSLIQAAELLGVDPQELGRWERGEFLPTRKMLARLKRGYGKSAEELGYGELEEYYISQYAPKAQRGERVAEASRSDDDSAPRRSDGPVAEQPGSGDGPVVEQSSTAPVKRARAGKSGSGPIVKQPSTAPAKRASVGKSGDGPAVQQP